MLRARVKHLLPLFDRGGMEKTEKLELFLRLRKRLIRALGGVFDVSNDDELMNVQFILEETGFAILDVNEVERLARLKTDF